MGLKAAADGDRLDHADSQAETGAAGTRFAETHASEQQWQGLISAGASNTVETDLPVQMILMMLMTLTTMINRQSGGNGEPETSIWWQRQRVQQRHLGRFLLPRLATQLVRRRARMSLRHRLWQR